MTVTSNDKIIYSATVTAPTNIACIKYWGKSNVKLNTPINSSLSVTISQDHLRAVTTASASRSFTSHRLWLNGIEEDITNSKRFHACLNGILELASDKVDEENNVLVKKEEWKQMHIHVSSYNTFPTAAGLASSAAGYAALVHAFVTLFCAKETYSGQFSTVARQGSGSACRSLYGGFVAWEQGDLKSNPDASDSIAKQIKPETHWPEFRALICVVSDSKKETSSTLGMQTSVATSSLLAHRAATVVPQRMTDIIKAIAEKNFQSFGEITMKDSNQFHATCLDTFPPIFYLNATSQFIISLIHKYNDFYSEVRVAYTFDAGPNAVLYTLDPYVDELSALLRLAFSNDEKDFFVGGTNSEFFLEEKVKHLVSNPREKGCVKKVYVANVGTGPTVLDEKRSLIDLNTGLNIYTP